MESKVYKPSASNLLIRGFVGMLFAFTGGTLGCMSLLVGSLVVLFLLAISEGIPPQAWVFAAAIPVGGLIFGTLSMVVGLLTAFSGRNDQIELTAEALHYTLGNATTTMYLSDITGLTSQWCKRPQQRGHWVLQIKDKVGHSVELAISQGGYFGAFEVLPILQDLMPRLPAAVEIDPRIQAYLAMGKMS
jgi:hypothetical protein